MIKLVIPKLEDYWYEQKIESDPKTMSYNAGWDVNYYGYHYDTGCIDFPKEKWVETKERREKQNIMFFYIYDSDIDSYVGYCHYKKGNRCDIGILIEDKYKGKEYGKKGLKLLCSKAFNDDIDKLYDNIEYSRENTIKLFKSIGFKVESEETNVRFNKEEKCALLSLTKEDFINTSIDNIRTPEDILSFNEYNRYINSLDRMNKEDLEKLIKELDLPKEEFYVISSGNLVLRGLFKDAGDLDICISEKGLELLKKKFNLKEKQSGFYQVTDKVECIVEDLTKRRYDDLGDYNGQSLEEYYEYLKTSKRPKDKIRLEIVEKELK